MWPQLTDNANMLTKHKDNRNMWTQHKDNANMLTNLRDNANKQTQLRGNANMWTQHKDFHVQCDAIRCAQFLQRCRLRHSVSIASRDVDKHQTFLSL